MDISKINFGAPAAERDINQGLVEYFVESEAYQNVLNRKKTIILGNRGTGKSAIFKVIAERERKRGALVIELSPEEYSYEILNEMMISENRGAWAKQGAYAAAWKYLIYVLVMKALSKEGSRLKTGAAEKIYVYLRDNHKGMQSNPISILIAYLKRIEGFKIGQIEASLKTKELTRLYQLEEINQLIPAVNELCKKRQVLILVDELDRGWDASEDAKAFVSGLFQAAIAINQVSEDLQVVASLRRELYDNIPSLYEDAQKVRDVIEDISWDERSLLKLIANRIRYSVPELSKKDDYQCWNLVFAETLEYRQTKSFNYMVDRTLYRPREIIQFCTQCLEEDTKNLIGLPIDYNVISKAELIYSGERAKDIAAEYRFQYPGLNSIFEVFRGKSYTFDRDALELLCLGITTGEYRVDDNAKRWVMYQEPEFLIDVLWRIGFLRAQAVGGIKAMRRSGSTYLGSHQLASLHLRNIPRFHVHPMFRSYLGLKESRDKSEE